MNPESTPLTVEFDTRIVLTILDGHLAAAGTLLCDPIAKVSLITRHTSVNLRSTTKAGGVGGCKSGEETVTVTVDERFLKATKQRIFTSHPKFDEILTMTVANASTAAGPSSAGTAATPPDAAMTTERFLVIDVEDSQRTFFGRAVCPFVLDRPSSSRGSTMRLMLVPRYPPEIPREAEHPTFLEDLRMLDKLGLDDFGFLNVQWDVAMIPRGGAYIPFPAAAAAMATAKKLPLPPLPVGLVVKALWIPSSVAGNSISQSDDNNAVGTWRPPRSAMSFSTSVEFGDGNAFPLEPRVPLFAGLARPDLLDKMTLTCTVQKGLHGQQISARVSLPLPPFTADTLDRDMTFCLPLWSDDKTLPPVGPALAPPRSAGSSSSESGLGLLLVTIRLLQKPIEGPAALCRDGAKCAKINDPKHQVQASHTLADWGRPMPDCPAGPYQPLFWESELHIARATERRWKRECIRGAHPTAEHVRHVFETLLGRVPLDLNIAQLASQFFNKAAAQLTTTDLQQLLLALVFHVEGSTVADAARFAFVLLRREAERAITVADVAYMLEHSLYGRTVDMPASEIARRVQDMFGAATTTSSNSGSAAASLAPAGALPTTTTAPTPVYITFDDFTAYLIQNASFWHELGAPLQFRVSEDRWEQIVAEHNLTASSSSPTGGASSFPPHSAPPVAANSGAPATPTPAASLPQSGVDASGGGAAADTNLWRTFTIRVIKTGRAFSVTSHVRDTIADVTKMVEESCGIAANRQKWIFHGLVVDNRRTVGDVFSRPQQTAEVSVQENIEQLHLVIVYREKNKKFEHTISATDKVLRLRAFVQQKTMIPLSRCVMTSCGQVMQDRHSLDHYNLIEGSIIEVSQQP